MASLLLLIHWQAYGYDDDEPVEKILIVGQTPLSSHNNTNYLLGSSQIITSETMNRSNAMSLTEQMNNTLASVNVNDVQNNPFQPDVQYRGFTASPLLGLPQGLSVYLNGIRFNEPFGDTVNWDLLPLSSLESVALFSGSNPIFGHNTLGGALALSTKNGFDFDRDELSLQLGSFGQRQGNVQLSGSNQNWAYYINANRYHEDGWRDDSPSEVKQLLINLSYRSPSLEANLLMATNDNQMIGNGAVPIELLALESPTAIYTQPDQTETQLGLIGLNLQATLSSAYSISGNAYYRRNKIDSINGDDSDYEPCVLNGGLTLCEGDDDDSDDLEPVVFAGYEPDVRLSDLSSVDAEDVDGTRNTGSTNNSSYGMTGQLLRHDSLALGDNELVFGVGVDRANVSFDSNTEFAILHNESVNDKRSVSGIGLFDIDSRVRLEANISHRYIYLMNTIEFEDELTLTLAGRYNSSKVEMIDLIDSGPGSLDGTHQYHRFNPAIGLSYGAIDNVILKASYSESSRTPSPAELSCADEDDPCKLPNGFVSDPPLEQVIVKTIEMNATYHQLKTQYSMTLFLSDSDNDIIFQQAGSKPSQGYFVNIEKNKRQGLELSALYAVDNYRLSASYNFLDATFESPFVSFSPVNPQGPDRQVSPGDTIPGQPRHQIKLAIEREFTDSVNVGGEFTYSSAQYYRGDEANENEQISGHSIVNLYLNYDVNPQLELSLRVDNVFNRRYYTFGTYGEADEVLGGLYPEISSAQFVGPAKPRAISLSASYKF